MQEGLCTLGGGPAISSAGKMSFSSGEGRNWKGLTFLECAIKCTEKAKVLRAKMPIDWEKMYKALIAFLKKSQDPQNLESLHVGTFIQKEAKIPRSQLQKQG